MFGRTVNAIRCVARLALIGAQIFVGAAHAAGAVEGAKVCMLDPLPHRIVFSNGVGVQYSDAHRALVESARVLAALGESQRLAATPTRREQMEWPP